MKRRSLSYIMANPACEKCKPDKPEAHEQLTRDTGCEVQYKAVSECMEKHRGNITNCKEQWATFKTCFKNKEGLKTAD